MVRAIPPQGSEEWVIFFVTIDETGYELVHEECTRGWRAATNNQMELQACIDALSLATGKRSPFVLSKFNKVVIYTDSQYVSQVESDQIVEALRKRGVDVEYMVKDNEGHGFLNADNRMDAYAAVEKFFAKHLGGRSE